MGSADLPHMLTKGSADAVRPVCSLTLACTAPQDQTDEVQQQPGWMQDGEGEETGESSPLPAVPLPGQSRPQQAASQPSGDLLSMGGDTPRAGADGQGPQSAPPGWLI